MFYNPFIRFKILETKSENFSLLVTRSFVWLYIRLNIRDENLLKLLLMKKILYAKISHIKFVHIKLYGHIYGTGKVLEHIQITVKFIEYKFFTFILHI